MKYPILNFSNTNFDSFVKQWSSFYNYDEMNLYDDNIIKSKLNVEDLINLYKWKNGSNLSEKKKEALQNKMLNKLDKINELRENFAITEFLTEFDNVSFVWKIFLLHIISPNEYPIYDQHVHRAYLFLNRDNSYKIIESPISDKEKDSFYFNIYLPFITELRINDNFKIRDLDKAFFSFGQFLKNYKIELIE